MAHRPPCDRRFDEANARILDATQRRLTSDRSFLALIMREGRAPDPLNMGYSQPFGVGMGLPPSRQIPTDHLALLCREKNQRWTRWIAPEGPRPESGGHRLLAWQSNSRRSHALMEALFADWEALLDDDPSDAIAVLLRPLASSLHVHRFGEPYRNCVMMPCISTHTVLRMAA